METEDIHNTVKECIDSWIGNKSGRLLEHYNTLAPLLLSRFKECEESVKIDIFRAYEALLKQTRLFLPEGLTNLDIALYNAAFNSEGNKVTVFSNATLQKIFAEEIDDHQRAILQALSAQVPQIVRSIRKQLKLKSATVRLHCFNLLTALVRALPGALNDHLESLIPAIKASILEKSTDSSTKIDTLGFLNLCFCSHELSVFYPHLDTLIPLIASCANEQFYKVGSVALTALQSLITVLKPLSETTDCTKQIDQIYDVIIAKLRLNDIDQEVKERAIATAGILLSIFGSKLGARLNDVLLILLDRLRNEMTCQVAVQSFGVIVANGNQVNLSSVMNELLTQLAEFLRKNQRALQVSTLLLLSSLVAKYTLSPIPDVEFMKIINRLPLLFLSKDLEISQLSQKFAEDTLSSFEDERLNKLKKCIDGFNEMNSMIYSLYIIVNCVDGKALTRKSIVDFGITTDPAVRINHRNFSHKYTSEKMIIVYEFVKADVPEEISSSNNFALILERILETMKDDFSLVENSKAGIGSIEDLDNKILVDFYTGCYFDLINESLDKVLSDPTFVTRLDGRKQAERQNQLNMEYYWFKHDRILEDNESILQLMETQQLSEETRNYFLDKIDSYQRPPSCIIIFGKQNRDVLPDQYQQNFGPIWNSLKDRDQVQIYTDFYEELKQKIYRAKSKPKPVQQNPDQSKQQKAPKKAEKANTSKKGGEKVDANESVDIGRLDLRVGRIVQIEKHPDANGFYLKQIDLGEEKPRTVISGLVKHVPIEEMQNRLVVCVCNLKSRKIYKIESQAMILCASTREKVEVINVDPSSKPGDRVITNAFPSRPDAVLNPKKKVWETVAVDLKVSDDGKAVYKGEELLVKGKSSLTAPTLRQVPIK